MILDASFFLSPFSCAQYPLNPPPKTRSEKLGVIGYPEYRGGVGNLERRWVVLLEKKAERINNY